MSKVIKVGQTIKHTLFGGGTYVAKIESIEKVKIGEKNGRMVDSMPIDNYGRDYILDLDNGHWCYAYQVISVVE